MTFIPKRAKVSHKKECDPFMRKAIGYEYGYYRYYDSGAFACP